MFGVMQCVSWDSIAPTLAPGHVLTGRHAGKDGGRLARQGSALPASSAGTGSSLQRHIHHRITIKGTQRGHSVPLVSLVGLRRLEQVRDTPYNGGFGTRHGLSRPHAGPESVD